MAIEMTVIAEEIFRVSQRLEKASRALYKLGDEKAEAERIYRMRLAQEILILKEKGMAVSMIGDVARGNVSDLLFQRDATESRFKAAMESLSALQSQLSALQSILRHFNEV